jgi:hypothetical protein
MRGFKRLGWAVLYTGFRVVDESLRDSAVLGSAYQTC